MPSNEEFSGSLSRYIKDNMKICLNNYESLPNFEILTQDEEPEVIMASQEITVIYNSKHTITNDKKTYEIEEFEFVQPTKLGTLYNSAKYLVDNQIESLGSTCLSCVVELSTTESLTIITTELEEGSIIYSISDKTEMRNNESLTLLFAFKSYGDPEF